MKKEELINKIISSADVEEEIEKYLDSGEIDYSDILTENEQNNLIFLFDNDIYTDGSTYARFPIFYRIQDYLDMNNINLNEYNLEDDTIRIDILENLFKIIVDSNHYTIYTPRILWEIISSLEPLYSFYNEISDIAYYYETILDIAFDLYSKTEDFICLDCIAAALQNLKNLKTPIQDQKSLLENFKKLDSIYKKIALDHMDFATDYLANLSHLISLSNETNNIPEIEDYLNDFVKFCKNNYRKNDKNPIPILKGILSLAPTLTQVRNTEKIKSLIRELIVLLNLIVKDRKVTVDIKDSILISLGILSFNLNELENSFKYLKKEAELIKEFEINRETLEIFSLYYLLKQISKEINDSEYEKLIQNLYHIGLNDDLLAALSQNELSLSNFRNKKALNFFLKKYNVKLSGKELLPDDRIGENPEKDEMITFIIYKLSLAQDYLDKEEYKEALKKLEEAKKYIDKLRDKDDLENYYRYQLEYELLKRTILFLTKEEVDNTKFINTISELLDSSLKNLKSNNKLSTPIPTLQNITATLLNNYEVTAGLEFLKVIYQLFSELEGAKDDIDLIEFNINLLFQLRRISTNKEELKWSEKIIEEFLGLLLKLDVSPQNYIQNIQYVEEGFLKDRFNSNEELNSSYKKAIQSLLLYPDAENTSEITDEIGQTYYIIGQTLKDLFKRDEALKFYRKALEYLTRFGINKENNKQFSTIIKTFLNISNIYKEIQDYEKSLEIIRDTNQIFNNSVEIIDSETLLFLKLNVLDHYYFLLYQLERFNEQQDVFEDLLLLLNDDIDKLGLIPVVFRALSLFMNMNEDKMEKPGSWSYFKYIEDIYKKLLEYKIPSEVENYPPDLQRGILNIYFHYLDYCIGQGKFISEKLLNQTIKLGYQQAEIYPNDREDLLFNIRQFELFRDRNILNNSFTKKKKVFKKRGKKTAGRNKKKRKKRR